MSLNGLADGDVLMYNSSTSTWSPSSLPQDNSSSIVSLQTYVTDLSGRTKTVQPHITSVEYDSNTALLQLSFTRDISTATFSAGNFTIENNKGIVYLESVYGLNNNLIFNISTSQVFYENFDDQLIVGDVTSADISNNGFNGSGYSLQSNDTNKYWHQTTSDSLPSDVVAVSFWHYAERKWY